MPFGTNWTLEYRREIRTPDQWELKEGSAHRGLFRDENAGMQQAFALGAKAVYNLTRNQLETATGIHADVFID